MNIAICDDNPYMASRLESLVDQAFTGNAGGYSCEVFPSGDSLLRYLAQHPLAFQVYFLDIEMEGTNGLETAQQIRKEDPNALIIFVTSHSELMPEAFGVLAFQFIVKPFEDEAAQKIILSAIAHLQGRNTLFQYVVRKQTNTLYLSQIAYIESIGRKVLLHVTNGDTAQYYGTLKEAAQKAATPAFAQSHASFIVNLEQVDQISGQMLRLRSGVELAISKKYHDRFHAAWRNFILMRGS